jgi:hypothetical protein
MIKNIFLSVILIFVCSAKLMGQTRKNDTIKIYQEVAGDYEYYSDMQYYYFNLYIENKTLLFKGLNTIAILKATPVDLINLQFKVSDSSNVQILYFIKGKSGEVSSCRVITDGIENLANKQNYTIPIAEKIYSV